MTWSLQNITCVVFTPPVPVPPPAHQVWSQVTGQQPAQFQQNPGGPGSAAQGPFDGFMLTAGTQPGRFEVSLHPIGDATSGSELPFLADIDGAVAKILELGSKLAAGDNPLRVAVVANCAQPGASQEEAIARFKQNAKLSNLPASASDLSFAMNVRKKLGGAGWEMNRLCNWGLGQLQFMQFQIQSGMQAPQVITTSHLATMVVDVNTVPRNIPLGPTQAVSALQALADEAKLIIAQGYDRLAAPD